MKSALIAEYVFNYTRYALAIVDMNMVTLCGMYRTTKQEGAPRQGKFTEVKSDSGHTGCPYSLPQLLTRGFCQLAASNLEYITTLAELDSLVPHHQVTPIVSRTVNIYLFNTLLLVSRWRLLT